MYYIITMANQELIRKINITTLVANGFDRSSEGVYHEKVLQNLSVVQVEEGAYEISVDGSPFYYIENGGVFVAPSDVVQKILHHDGKNGKMRAHWVFIDAIVNDAFRLDDLFTFPVIVDPIYNEQIRNIISAIRSSDNYFPRIKSGYDLVELLCAFGKEKPSPSAVKTKIETFVKNNYAQDIKASDIASHLFCSIAQVFRYTKKYFGISPSNYINLIRLQNAETLLRNTDKSVTEISLAVGFTDGAYFSKLFKKIYYFSPKIYRLNLK